MSQWVRACLVHVIQWSASEGVSNVFDFEHSSGLPVDLPLDRAAATACVDIGGMIYSNFRESRVNVTGPYVAKSEQGKPVNRRSGYMSPH